MFRPLEDRLRSPKRCILCRSNSLLCSQKKKLDNEIFINSIFNCIYDSKYYCNSRFFHCYRIFFTVKLTKKFYTKIINNNIIPITCSPQCMSSTMCLYFYPYPVSIDFGVEHLVELAGTMNFPWLMSNVCDKHTGRLLAEGKRKLILEWKGKKVHIRYD